MKFRKENMVDILIVIGVAVNLVVIIAILIFYLSN